MNRFRVVGGGVSILHLALKVPFITAAGRKDATDNAVIRLRLAGGAQGYGEASGSIVHAGLKAGRLAEFLRSELRRALGRDARAFSELSRRCWNRCGPLAPAAAAFECALLDALTRQLGIAMAEWFGGALDRLETDVTLSAASPAQTRRAAARASEEGFRIFKVKVGTGAAEDWARVRTCWETVRRAVDRPRIILDGNQGMTPASALRLAERCLKSRVRVVLLEQPLPRRRLKDCAALRRRCPVPLAADEDVRSPAEALAVLEAGAADVLNVKVAKTGILASLEIIAAARAAGKRLMIGCMQESTLGLAAGVHLALGTGAFEFADLDSDHLLAADQPRLPHIGGRHRAEGAAPCARRGGFIREGPILRLER